MMNVHKNYLPDWQTPPEWMAWVGASLGADFFDPCPANPKRDGLTVDWKARVYVNPPGANSVKSIKPWWEKHILERNQGFCNRLIWCFFNCEATRILDPSPFDMSGEFVVPKKRVAFIHPTTGKVVKSPRNWTWFWKSYEVPFVEPPEPCFYIQTSGHL